MFLYEPFLYGYSLGISKWGQLLVKDLEPVQWDVNMFNDLVLAQPQKELLKSLAQRHYFGQERPPKDMSQEDENTSSPSALLDSRDITKSKGKGLVVALHGPPGTGKPMTAGMPPMKRVINA